MYDIFGNAMHYDHSPSFDELARASNSSTGTSCLLSHVVRRCW